VFTQGTPSSWAKGIPSASIAITQTSDDQIASLKLEIHYRTMGSDNLQTCRFSVYILRPLPLMECNEGEAVIPTEFLVKC